MAKIAIEQPCATRGLQNLVDLSSFHLPQWEFCHSFGDVGLDAGAIPSTHGNGVVHVASADALGNPFPEGARGLLWREQVLDLAFPAFGDNTFLAVVSLWICLSSWSTVRSGIQASSGVAVVL